MGFGQSKDGENDMVVSVETKELRIILQKNRKTHIEEYEKATAAYVKKFKKQLSEDVEALKAFAVLINEAADKVESAEQPRHREGALKNIRTLRATKTPMMKAGSLQPPQSHQKDYDDAIGMLELHQGAEMKLDLAAYQRFVKDDWSWKRQFQITNSGYVIGDAEEDNDE